jgi:uncharacterized membrane protein
MKKLNLLLVALMFLSGYYFLPSLPNKMPMHWNIRGEVDNYMPKGTAIWIMPAIALACFILFQFLPLFDPKKEKYKLFKTEWEIIQTALIGFFAYMQFLTFYIAMNPKTEMMPLMFIGLGILFVLMGNYMSKIRQNYFIGVKTPWTLASEDNWNKTHRFASWTFVIAGVITLVEAYFIWYAPVVIFGSIMLAAVLPIIYSFLIFKKVGHKMKYVLLAVAGLLILIFSMRFLAGEDDWICKDGRWIKHGAPSSPMPKEPCR